VSAGAGSAARRGAVLVVGLSWIVLVAATSRGSLTLEPRHLKTLTGRSIGPANMGGRISDLAVVEKNSATFFLGTGTGGLFKTTNRGTTWRPLFDEEAVASIGAVAVWQKNPSVVWVGTGEANSRNSSSWGNGVYRSLDGGTTWTHVGLRPTHHIARVTLDPADSNVAYVAALGRLWGENPERGIFKTRDGGRTWEHVLKVDASTGAVDLQMDPSNPRVLYAALYARKRQPWSYRGTGKTGGIFRTQDGGRTWKKLTAGLPARTGRIGLDVYRKDPKHVYAVIESDEGGHLEEFEERSRAGGVFRSADGGEHWTRLSAWSPRPFYFSQIRVQPDDENRVYLLGTDLWISDDGGRTFRARGARNIHPDVHAMWIDPVSPSHLILGTDGGTFQSFDRGENWDFLNNLALGEFYTVALDNRRPYRVYGGLQDNQTWGGPSHSRFDPEPFLEEAKHDGITNDQWFCLGGGDGFYVAVDPTNPDLVYFESQGAYIRRLNLATGTERNIRPSNREGEPVFRFNWNSPFVISPHDPSVLWLGGNHLFRLFERGEKWELASPDLTTRDPVKMATGGSAAETHCTITTLQESEKTKGLIWVGTDDGKLWLTRDGGGHWTDVTTRLRGVPRGLYVSRVEASHHDPAVAYVAIDGHRTNDFRPYLLMTRDYGNSWSSITANLPAETPVKVIREGRLNPQLLFAGTEFGLYASLDRGGHWMKLGELPTVAVDDLAIHPRDRDLVVATHGRSLYVLDDIGALEHWTPQVLRDSVTLFPPRAAYGFHYRTMSGLWGQRMFSAKNPPAGAWIDYFVSQDRDEEVEIAIADSADRLVRKLTGPGTPGLHRIPWDLQAREPLERIARSETSQPVFVPAGRYTVKLSYGKAREREQPLLVEIESGAEPLPE
jgi:photosystem II stability/assembly factor-like uncharacterized protein